jgi:multiple sugar transport system permease protein
MTYDPTQWFTHFTLDNLPTAFSTERGNRFGDAPINSFIVSGVTTVVALLIAVFAA